MVDWKVKRRTKLSLIFDKTQVRRELSLSLRPIMPIIQGEGGGNRQFEGEVVSVMQYAAMTST